MKTTHMRTNKYHLIKELSPHNFSCTSSQKHAGKDKNFIVRRKAKAHVSLCWILSAWEKLEEWTVWKEGEIWLSPVASKLEMVIDYVLTFRT